MMPNFMIQWFPEWEGKHDQFLNYAEVYKESLITIINAINSNHDLRSNNSPDVHPAILANHDYGILPALFLFRHYIELQLKGMILQNGGTLDEINSEHGIKSLLNLLKQKSNPTMISDDTETFILELHALDSSSQGFRYPFTRSGRMFFANIVEQDLNQVNVLREFVNRATQVITDLENQEGDFDMQEEIRDNHQ